LIPSTIGGTVVSQASRDCDSSESDGDVERGGGWLRGYGVEHPARWEWCGARAVENQPDHTRDAPAGPLRHRSQI